MKTPMALSVTSSQREQTSLRSQAPRLPRSNVCSTRDLENPSASVHLKRFSTPSLTLKFLCAGKSNPRLQKSIAILKDSSGVWDVESYAVQGLVIAGRIPTTKAQLKSLELFRKALKSVTVISFDELVAKLEHLLEVLGTPRGGQTT